MTAERQIVPGRSYLLSRRCLLRLMLLAPNADVEQIYLYCLADAARRTNVELNAWAAMSNHHHVIVFDRDGRLPEFLHHAHVMMAKALNALRGRWENFWSAEQ